MHCPTQLAFTQMDWLCSYTIQITVVSTLFWGWTSSLFSMYAYNIISLHCTLCLFSLHPFFSLHVFIHGFGWLFCLHVLCGMNWFFCFLFFVGFFWFVLVFFWMCICFLLFVLTFWSLVIWIFYIYFLLSPLFSPHLLNICSVCLVHFPYIFFYIFALKRPPKVALPWYSLPGLPWNETIFSLCSEVCGWNTLPFAHLMGWELFYP